MLFHTGGSSNVKQQRGPASPGAESQPEARSTDRRSKPPPQQSDDARSYSQRSEINDDQYSEDFASDYGSQDGDRGGRGTSAPRDRRGGRDGVESYDSRDDDYSEAERYSRDSYGQTYSDYTASGTITASYSSYAEPERDKGRREGQGRVAAHPRQGPRATRYEGDVSEWGRTNVDNDRDSESAMTMSSGRSPRERPNRERQLADEPTPSEEERAYEDRQPIDIAAAKRSLAYNAGGCCLRLVKEACGWVTWLESRHNITGAQDNPYMCYLRLCQGDRQHSCSA